MVHPKDDREWVESNVLVHQIDADLYSRQGGALTNFQAVLPAPQSDLAQSLLKSEYNLEFLDPREKALERDLERALLEHMQKFLLELGVGFAFVGSQYRLDVEGDGVFRRSSFLPPCPQLLCRDRVKND